MNSLIKSIENAMVPVHREGYKFVLLFLAGTLVLGWIWDPLFWIGLLLTGWCAYFFRDPVRVTPLDDDLVISPADGRVSGVTRVTPPSELDLGSEEMLRISVFLNVFDCHINRAPINGPIKHAVHKSGSFLNAELDKASEENERASLVIDNPHGAVGVVQIAGFVARRIVCWKTLHDTLETGERFGLIRFGSRVDTYLPLAATARVSVGQTVIAGETVIAEFNAARGKTVSRRA